MFIYILKILGQSVSTIGDRDYEESVGSMYSEGEDGLFIEEGDPEFEDIRPLHVITALSEKLKANFPDNPADLNSIMAPNRLTGLLKTCESMDEQSTNVPLSSKDKKIHDLFKSFEGKMNLS